MNRLFRHALTSWIACLAILFGTLAPTLSHAIPKGPNTADFPICSAAGHKMVDGKTIGIDPGFDSFRHCPFCTDGHHAPGLLPSTPALLVAVGGPILPALFYKAPEPLFPWAATRSRAPPFLS